MGAKLGTRLSSKEWAYEAGVSVSRSTIENIDTKLKKSNLPYAVVKHSYSRTVDYSMERITQLNDAGAAAPQPQKITVDTDGDDEEPVAMMHLIEASKIQSPLARSAPRAATANQEILQCIDVIETICDQHKEVPQRVSLRYLAAHYQEHFTLTQMKRAEHADLFGVIIKEHSNKDTIGGFKKQVNEWITPWGYEVYSRCIDEDYEYWLDKACTDNNTSSSSKRTSRPWDNMASTNENIQEYLNTTPLQQFKKQHELTKRIKVLEQASDERDALKKQIEELQKNHQDTATLRVTLDSAKEQVELLTRRARDFCATEEKLKKLVAEERKKLKEEQALKLSLETENKTLQESVKINSDQAIANNHAVNRLKNELDKVNAHVMELIANKTQLQQKVNEIKALFDDAGVAA